MSQAMNTKGFQQKDIPEQMQTSVVGSYKLLVFFSQITSGIKSSAVQICEQQVKGPNLSLDDFAGFNLAEIDARLAEQKERGELNGHFQKYSNRIRGELLQRQQSHYLERLQGQTQ